MIATSHDTGKDRPSTKSGRWRWVALFGVVVVIGVIIAGLATSGQGSKSSASGLCRDKLTQMMQDQQQRSLPRRSVDVRNALR